MRTFHQTQSIQTLFPNGSRRFRFKRAREDYALESASSYNVQNRTSILQSRYYSKHGGRAHPITTTHTNLSEQLRTPANHHTVRVVKLGLAHRILQQRPVGTGQAFLKHLLLSSALPVKIVGCRGGCRVWMCIGVGSCCREVLVIAWRWRSSEYRMC